MGRLELLIEAEASADTYVLLRLDDRAGHAFTERNHGRGMAIVLDGRVESVARIEARIDHRGQITRGRVGFEAEELQRLVTVMFSSLVFARSLLDWTLQRGWLAFGGRRLFRSSRLTFVRHGRRALAAEDGLDQAFVAFDLRYREDVRRADLERQVTSLLRALLSAAAIAALFALSSIVLYLRVRFHEYRFGLAASVALLHDMLFTLSAIALARWTGLLSLELDHLRGHARAALLHPLERAPRGDDPVPSSPPAVAAG